MAELGKIEKPSLNSFSGKKKLYCVANIYPIPKAPEEYRTLFERYWQDVASQTERIETAGKIKKIFCEAIYVKGEEAFEALAGINEKALEIVRRKSGEGAEIIPIEDKTLFESFMDWANCLKVVRSHEVFSKVFEFFSEVSEKRLQNILEVIKSSLAEGEAGLLIMRDEDRSRLQFPTDIEIFLITPPSYDDVMRWLRDKAGDMLHSQ